jgi:hypothetical protein
MSAGSDHKMILFRELAEVFQNISIRDAETSAQANLMGGSSDHGEFSPVAFGFGIDLSQFAVFWLV